MKAVVRTTLAAAVLAAYCGLSYAETAPSPQQGRGPAAMKRARGERGDPEKRLRLMNETLGLSADQSDRILPIITAEQTELEKLRADNTLNRDQRRARLQELNRSYSEKIRQILTPEQQKKQDAIRETISENRSKTRGSRPGAVPAEFTPEKRIVRLTDHLALSTEQQARILPILQDEYAQLKTLPANDSYNREQRRAKLQEITRETSARLMPELTPEQQKKYTETRQKITDRRAQKKRGGEKGQERVQRPE